MSYGAVSLCSGIHRKLEKAAEGLGMEKCEMKSSNLIYLHIPMLT